VIIIPRRRPETVTEIRQTLGDFERQIEADKVAMQGVQALATALGGIAAGIGGLGIGGGLLLAGLLWGRDLQQLVQDILDIWPESGRFLSPEWIARWGDDPMDIIEEDLTAPDNPTVNVLDPTIDGKSFEGLSSADVYIIACSGRAAAYDHSKNNIINNWLLQQPPTNNLVSPLVGDYKQGLTNEQKALIIAEWHRNNPPPPMCLTLDQQKQNTLIRITCARNNAATQPYNPLSYFVRQFSEHDPTKVDGYVDDYLLDWLAYSSDKVTTLGINVLNAASPSPYDYRSRRSKGEQIIQAYSWWSAP
jgi:hypothetical protein